MKLFELTYSLGAARMIECMPERAFRITVAAESEEAAYNHAVHMARRHYDTYFKSIGQERMLSKYVELADIKEIKPSIAGRKG